MIGNIQNPFVWGDAGQAMTPEQVARRRAMAAALAQDSTSTSPLGHWTQAAARGLGGYLSGRSERIASRAEEEGLASADAAIQGNPLLSALMGGEQMAPAPMPAVGGGAPVAAQGGGAFPASLIQSESGGNWNALNSEGYGGRLQFGAARLADAANAGVIPAGMSGADFSRLSPDQQSAVENWHFADIDRQAAKRGLDQYIGQNIGGTTITQDAIRAMAHLGGIGGAANFLQSGGASNPADSNGTSLADYARMHAGGGGSVGTNAIGQVATPQQAPSGVVAALAAAQQNPWVTQKYGGLIDALMGQEMQRQNAAYDQSLRQADPMYQAQLQGQMLQNQAAMQPARSEPVFEGGQWWDTSSGQPIALTEAAPDDSAAASRIARLTQNLQDTGDFVDPQEAEQIATAIVDGRYTTDRHPVSGALQVVDVANGNVIYRSGGNVDASGAPQPIPENAPSRSTMPTDVDYSGATGSSGLASNIANTVSEVLNLGLIAPNNERATAALNNLSRQTMIDLAGAVAGRPSNYLLEQFNSMTVSPNSPFQGPGRSGERLQQTRDMIDAGILENRDVAASPDYYPPATVAEARRNITRLTRLRDDYDVVLDSFKPERGSDAAQAGSAPPDVDQRVWEFMTPEERALWQ